MKKIFKITTAIPLLFILVAPVLALAAEGAPPAESLYNRVIKSTVAAGETGAGFGIASQAIFFSRAAKYVGVVTSIVSVVAFILIIYSGWLWFTANGNEEQITKAKGTIKMTISGLILIALAGLIAYTIFYLFVSQGYFFSIDTL